MVNDTSLQRVRQRLSREARRGHCDEAGVRRLWWGALEVIQESLLEQNIQGGLWMAAPLPALYEPELLEQLHGWVWAPDSLERLNGSPNALPISGRIHQGDAVGFRRLPLEDRDGDDPLLLVITSELQLALTIDGEPGKRQLLMRCDAESLSDALTLMGERLNETSAPLAEQLRQELTALGSLRNDPDFDRRFWPRLAEKLTETAPSLTLQSMPDTGSADSNSNHDLSLLEAITHEVRTPLATIRTLIRFCATQGSLRPCGDAAAPDRCGMQRTDRPLRSDLSSRRTAAQAFGDAPGADGSGLDFADPRTDLERAAGTSRRDAASRSPERSTGCAERSSPSRTDVGG